MSALAVVRRARRRQRTLVLAALAAGLVGVFAVRVLLGDFTVTVPDFVRILGGAQIPSATFVVMESKLPAAVAGTLAGAAFGVAGGLHQAVLRNPLASPDVLGVSLGASVGALGSTVLLGWDGASTTFAALVTALAVALFVQGVGGSGSNQQMILVGVAAAAGLGAMVQWLLQRANSFQAQDALIWLTGSLNSPTWAGIGLLAVVLVVTLPLATVVAGRLPLLETGRDSATALGSHAPRVRAVALLLGVVLAAVATSVTGPIAFVSLLAGPIARRLVGGRTSVAVAALVGAVIVVAADHVARYLLPTGSVPVGVVTGAIGAPFLLALLVSTSTPKDRP